MIISRVALACVFSALVTHHYNVLAQAVENGEPRSAVEAITGKTVQFLRLRLVEVPAISVAEIERELEMRGIGHVLLHPYDQKKVDQARNIIRDMYRAIAGADVRVDSWARRRSDDSVEVVFSIGSK